jgi:hypothetical protein
VYENAIEQQKEMDVWLEFVKETAIDCVLHQDKCYEDQNKNKNKPLRKRIKVEVDGKMHYFFVESAHGEWQKMYKDKNGEDTLGFITFGPPHLFYDSKKERRLFSELL